MGRVPPQWGVLHFLIGAGFQHGGTDARRPLVVGTLDAETLDVALDALDNLNASGKMIGVISHIEAMKERIPTQLKVIKRNGVGLSALEKPYAVG